jgi:hypothetical protein
MRIGYVSKPWLIAVVGCLLCLMGFVAAFADAKADLSITPNGACVDGGTTFVITNNNPNSSILASVAQTSSSGTTTLQISLQPREQKVLGCAPQGPAGNFLTKWQVQSAQYQ